jgi:hypothetical protein
MKTFDCLHDVHFPRLVMQRFLKGKKKLSATADGRTCFVDCFCGACTLYSVKIMRRGVKAYESTINEREGGMKGGHKQ